MEGQYAFHYTWLSRKPFRDKAARFQRHALAKNFSIFLRRIELHEAMAVWSLTSLRLELIKIGPCVVRDARTNTFTFAEVAVSAR